MRSQTTRADVKPCAVTEKRCADKTPAEPAKIILPEIHNEFDNDRDAKTQHHAKQPDALELRGLAKPTAAGTYHLDALGLRMKNYAGFNGGRRPSAGAIVPAQHGRNVGPLDARGN